MLVITSGEFIENPNFYLDKIDAGEEIFMQCGTMNTYFGEYYSLKSIKFGE